MNGFDEEKDENNMLTSCSCGAGKEIINGQCLTKCEDENASAIGANQNCICNEGYYLNFDGICTFDCRSIPYSYTNSNNDACECEENYTKENNECVYSCNTTGNMVANSSNNGCICETGYFQTNDPEVCENPCSNITCEQGAECLTYNSEYYSCQCSSGTNFKLNYGDKLVISNLSGLYDIKVATNSGNSYALVWSGNTSDTDTKQSIFMSILDSEGTVIKEPFIVNGDYDKNKFNPTVIWGNGKYVVAWEDQRYTTDVLDTRDIFFRIVSEDGTLAPETRLTFTSSNNSYAWAPKLLWNPTRLNYAVFWKEKKRDVDTGVLGNTTVYYRIIKAEGDFLINFKATTAANISVSDFDVTLNKDDDYSMVWIKEDVPRRLYYQVLNSDDAIINSDGVIQLAPINLLYTAHNTNEPKIIWNGMEYAVFYRDTSNASRYSLVLLNENNQKLGSEINLNISDTPRDLYWNGNEYVFASNIGADFYMRKISWDGRLINGAYNISDGYSHTFYSSLLLIDLNNTKSFWIDNRNDTYDIYFSELGCF
jgi:hypothetical protein